MGKKYSESLEERQRACMLAMVRDILSDRSIESVTIENAHGALSVSRSAGERERQQVEAIGFISDMCEDDESDEGCD